MKQEMLNALKQMDEVDFMELSHALDLAVSVREMLRESNRDLTWFAVRMGISMAQAKAIINGYFPFDLRTVSKMQTVKIECFFEQKKTEAGEILTFPDYKYSKRKIKN